MREREARASRSQIKRVADGRTIDILNYEEVETGAHGTRMRQTEASPITVPAIADPQGESIFQGDFGVGTSYQIVFIIADADVPDALTDAGGKESSSRVKYEGETYLVETVNNRFPAGFTMLGCDDGDEP